MHLNMDMCKKFVWNIFCKPVLLWWKLYITATISKFCSQYRTNN